MEKQFVFIPEFVPPFLARVLRRQNCSAEQEDGLKFCLAPFELQARLSSLMRGQLNFSQLMAFIPENEDIAELKRQRTQIEVQISSIIEAHSRLLEIGKEGMKESDDEDAKVKLLKKSK